MKILVRRSQVIIDCWICTDQERSRDLPNLSDTYFLMHDAVDGELWRKLIRRGMMRGTEPGGLGGAPSRRRASDGNTNNISMSSITCVLFAWSYKYDRPWPRRIGQ